MTDEKNERTAPHPRRAVARRVFRVAAFAVSAVGVLLLVNVFRMAAAGGLSEHVFHRADLPPGWGLGALALALPVPFHVMSIGLIVQRRWLSPAWARVALVGIVTSGCWLGLALAIKVALR